MHGAVVEVGGQSSDIGVGCSAVLGVDGVTGSLLLVRDEVLCSGLDTSILVTSDGLLHGNTSEVRVSSEALPVTASIGRATKRSSNRAKSYVSALSFELLTHGITTFVEQFPVP